LSKNDIFGKKVIKHKDLFSELYLLILAKVVLDIFCTLFFSSFYIFYNILIS